MTYASVRKMSICHDADTEAVKRSRLQVESGGGKQQNRTNAIQASDTIETRTANQRTSIVSSIILLIVSLLFVQALKLVHCDANSHYERPATLINGAPTHENNNNNQHHRSSSNNDNDNNSNYYFIHQSQRIHAPKRATPTDDAANRVRASISLRQVLVPLLTVGHSNRKQTDKLGSSSSEGDYADAQDRSRFEGSKAFGAREQFSGDQLAKSLNNRGHSNALRVFHTSRPHQRNRLLDSYLSFGQRRRQDTDGPSLQLDGSNSGVGSSSSGPSGQFGDNDLEPATTSGIAAASAAAAGVAVQSASRSDSFDQKSTKWSQPDPRKSYSLPVSLIKVVTTGSGRRRLASRRAESGGGGGSSLTSASSQQFRSRNEPLLEISSTTEQAILSSTPSSLQSSSLDQPTSELSTNSLFDSSDTSDGEIVSSGQSNENQQQQQQQHQLILANRYQVDQNHVSATPPKQQPHPMVTLIRYVPVSLSVPAEQVAAVVAASAAAAGAGAQAVQGARHLNYADLSSASSTTGSSSLLDQLYRYRQQQQQRHGDHYNLAPIKQQQPLAAAAEYHIIDTILPGADTNNGMPPLKQAVLLDKQSHQQHQDKLGAGSSGDISSELYSHLYSSSGLNLNQPIGSGQVAAISLDGQQAGPLAMLLASGTPGNSDQHATLTRLAYVPVGQPTQLNMPMGHAASKAISAYASRLISMLRPSTLLSTIGSSSLSSSASTASAPMVGQLPSGYSINQQAARTNPLPHIYLLAPAETVVPPATVLTSHGLVKSPMKPASRQQRQQVTTSQPSIIQQKHEDLLMNQASKVHSTKSHRQPTVSKQHEVSWPLAPQMNGLVCIQGIIGTKGTAAKHSSSGQQQQQQQRAQAHQQQHQPMISQAQIHDDDLGSFDYERPKNRPPTTTTTTTTTTSPQLIAASTTQQSPIKSSKLLSSPLPPLAKGQVSKGGRARESPLRLAQKMTAKLNGHQDQTGRSPSLSYASPDYSSNNNNQDQQLQHITQQRLIGLSSDESSSILDTNLESSGRQQRQSAGSSGQNDDTGRSIIPFTIRDKIDVPANRVKSVHEQRQFQRNNPGLSSPTTSAPSSQTNGPVQYDEPSEIDSTAGAGAAISSRNRLSSVPVETDQRRSRTSFAASSPISSNRLQHKLRNEHSAPLALSSSGVEIDYKKEMSASASKDYQRNDYSLPVLMASSAPARNHSKQPVRPVHEHYATGAPAFSRSAPPPPLSDQSGARRSSSSGLVVSSHELMGLSSSASSVSTTTAATTASATTRPPDLTTSTPTQVTDHDRTNSASANNLGQLISSISLSRNSNELGGDNRNNDKESDRSRPLMAQYKKTSGNNETTTVELIVNSTPRDQQLQQQHSNVNSFAPSDHFVTQNITASPLYLQQQQTDSTATTTQQSIKFSSNMDDQHDANSDQAHDTNTFSNDRTLSSTGSAGSSGASSFGKISESLQTNPLDLIDLQNSRSSFELPSQLESLSMFYSDSRRDTLNQAETSNGTEERRQFATRMDTNTDEDKRAQSGQFKREPAATSTNIAQRLPVNASQINSGHDL